MNEIVNEQYANEEWRRVTEYENVEAYVSNLGRIKVNDIIVTGSDDGQGYLVVSFGRGTGPRKRVHNVVATYFVEKPESDELLMVNHKDGIKTNNVATNLEWITNRENTLHGVYNGRYSDEKDATPIVAIDKESRESIIFRNQSSASKFLRIPGNEINKGLKGRNCVHGYYFGRCRQPDVMPWQAEEV